MGLFKRILGSPSTSTQADEPAAENPPRNKSNISLVPLSEVTEASLKVFRQLPGTIRHDPSMISFQQENERWKGEHNFNFIFALKQSQLFTKNEKYLKL